MFVPVVPYVPPTPPSPRTRELAALLSYAVREYEADHPAVTRAEIREALDLASREAGAASATDVRAVAGVLSGVLVLVAGVVWFGFRAGSLDAASLPMVAVAVAVLVVLVGVLLLRKTSGG